MGFILLWLESLAAAMLLTAAGITIAARRRTRWPVIVAILPALVAAAYPALSVWMIQTGRAAGSMVNSLKVGSLAWATALTIGTLVVAIVGMRRVGEPPRRRARDWLALRLALSGVAGLVLFVATLWSMTNALMPQIAALRAEAGTFALAAAPSPLSDHENAAPLYEAAAEWLTTNPDEQSKLVGWLEAETLDPNDPDLRAFLDRRATGLDLIRQASARAGCRFDSSPSQSHGTLDAANHVRGAMMVVALQARYLAARGATKEAIEQVDQMMRMSGHVAANPDVMASLASAALESQALATLDKILVHGVTLANGQEVHLGDDPILYRYHFRRALQTEEALVYGRLAGIAEQATGFGLLLLDDELAAYHAIFRRMAEELAKPYPECLRGWSGLEAEFVDIPGALYRLSIQAYIRVLTAIARADASRRVAQLAVAVASYRAGEGKFPARVEDVVPKYMPQVPLDPFTGQPLKLKPTADGVVVYSVGPDGVDDGGQPLTDDRPPKGDVRVRIGEKK